MPRKKPVVHKLAVAAVVCQTCSANEAKREATMISPTTYKDNHWSALASAVFFVGYLLFGKKIRQSVANTSYSVVIYLTASLFFGATALLQNYQFTDYPGTTWLAIGASILLPTLLGHALFTYLMKFMNINLMTCGKLIEPAISSITAYFLFAEHLSDNTVVAFFLMSTAIVILFYPVIRQSLLDR